MEERFRQAIEKYEEQTNTGVDLREPHTMSELWEILDRAVDKYNIQDVQGFWGRIRKAFRKFGEHSGAVEGWLGLLPKESHYLSVVCGGFKLILTVHVLHNCLVGFRRACTHVH